MRKNDLITLRVTDINNLGVGVGHLENCGDSDGQTVFLRGGVSGDLWEARIIKVTKGYLVARPERLLEASPHRTDNDGCAVSKTCGGCAYRAVTYAHECELKRGYVQNAFRKAGLPEVEIEPVRSTGKLCGYRNKGQYPVGQDKDGRTVAGFYAAASHRIVPTPHCELQPQLFSDVVAYLCAFADRHSIPAYCEESGRGLLRHFYLRVGAETGELMVCLVLTADKLPGERELIAELPQKFPQLKSLMVNINSQSTNVILGDRYRLLWGNGYITDKLCGRELRISPQSFYQVNHDACELLYGLAKQRAGLQGSELLLDLYCGIGSIGLSMADAAGEVLGMEIVPEAVQCAAENAARNCIANASFSCGDAGDPQGLLHAAAELKGELSQAVVVLDPPRKGTTPELIGGIADHGIQRVVYVSCNPDTLARDCKLFAEHGYRIGKVTPVDLFPRTGHVESVVLLTKAPHVHQMKLHAAPFEMIKSGEKTIELRLYDEKRQKIKAGDEIVFTNTVSGEALHMSVARLHCFGNFEELYRTLPLLKCGYTEEDVGTARASDMEQYYSAEEQLKYGVVGIELCR